MTGATGTPPTSPDPKQNTAKSVQGSTGSASGATTDTSQPVSVKTNDAGQSAAEKTLDTERPAAEKILESNPSTTTAPKLTSGSQIETATTIPGPTGSSQMGMGGVVEPSLPQGSTTTTGSGTSHDQRDPSGQPEGLAETASQYSRNAGRRASEVYEQGRQAARQVWDTGQYNAYQVRRQGRQGLSSVQRMLRDNPVAGIMIGAAAGVLVGYLIGHATASAGTTRTRRYSDRDELGDAGNYPGCYGGSYSSSSRYPDGDRNTNIHRYADRVRYSDGN